METNQVERKRKVRRSFSQILVEEFEKIVFAIYRE